MRLLKGTVISASMQKTIVVRVDMLRQHPKYGKHYRASKKFKAHDEKGEYRVGDIVMMQETRPLSKEKRWKVISLVRKFEATMDDSEAESLDSGKAKSLIHNS